MTVWEYHNLINALLDDGSPQSILKLKNIVVLKDIQLHLIHDRNIICFLNLFKEYYMSEDERLLSSYTRISRNMKLEFANSCKEICAKIFETNPHLIEYFPKEHIFDIVTKLYKDSFSVGFGKIPFSIRCIPDDKSMITIMMFKDIYSKAFKDYPRILDYIPKPIRFKLITIFPDSFSIAFKNHIDSILAISLNKRIDLVKMFTNSFKIAFENNPNAIKLFPKKNRNEIKKMFPDVKWNDA